jgi:hypothetical protein
MDCMSLVGNLNAWAWLPDSPLPEAERRNCKGHADQHRAGTGIRRGEGQIDDGFLHGQWIIAGSWRVMEARLCHSFG